MSDRLQTIVEKNAIQCHLITLVQLVQCHYHVVHMVQMLFHHLLQSLWCLSSQLSTRHYTSLYVWYTVEKVCSQHNYPSNSPFLLTLLD